MNNKVTIIMYHYVRDLENSRYPGIKGLDTSLFKGQVNYLLRHYNFVSVEQLIDANENKTALPPKSCLLTFDDAYIDHFTNVFPVLNQHKIQGAFFPPIKAVTEHTVLDVNKIHFILAAVEDKKQVITEIFKQLSLLRKEHGLLPDETYYTKLGIASRYDSADVMFIKNLLQYELETGIRNQIIDHLFVHFLQVDEKSFSQELYMSEGQIKYMLDNGMHIGSHGLNHYWLGKLTKEQQRTEIEASVEFLKRIGVDENYLSICYPFGSYNSDTLELLPEYGFKAGFTTEVDIAELTEEKMFTLARLDTNDLPKEENASVNSWFLKG
jgi:peptidoglycan/xylan/chitin deacetylase (PgdA/CDA1 family)